MKKTDLILNLLEKNMLSKAETKACVDAILSILKESIVTGEGVEIRGFGSFSRKYKNARTGVNPRTGKKTQVDAKFMPFFKPGKLLKEVVNN